MYAYCHTGIKLKGNRTGWSGVGVTEMSWTTPKLQAWMTRSSHSPKDGIKWWQMEIISLRSGGDD